MTEGAREQRTIGLLGATGVGVGAIVGGGIFVLAGVAYASAGPSAMIAFAVNGAIAFITAMSFAELSSAFPDNGGPYTFAKKVMNVRAAFAVGWILWFAYIVAGVLYALGFASFAVLAAQGIWHAAGSSPPAWLFSRRVMLLLATAATAMYALSLARKAAGGGQFATYGKIVVFIVLILAGVVAFARTPLGDSMDNVSPFFSGGASGLLTAMGLTFIALQGFDLIAAVAGEIKDPGRNVPRAMFLSLGCALAVYLPLLFLIASVGVEGGHKIDALAEAQPANVIPIAAKQFLGTVGYWLVIAAAVLSTLSALQANLLAASRVALAMAKDRTLPTVLGDVHKVRRTPVIAIYASMLTLVAIVFMVPDLAGAGSAASLIFLLVFLLAHLMTYLARVRGGTVDAPYQTPWFPLIPIAGGVACGLLALFQALTVPDAGGIVLIWLGLGVILYWSLFARRAELADASAEALDPDLVKLRGQNPLVLVPIANPDHATALIAVANALAPTSASKVLLLSIVPIPDSAELREVPPQYASTQRVVDEALRQSYSNGFIPEALITAAAKPLDEIRRIANEHNCHTLLLGLGATSDDHSEPALEALINDVDADVALMRAPGGWSLDSARRLLVPVGGRGEQHGLRARLLGSLCRDQQRDITFITVLAPSTSDAKVEYARRSITQLADIKVRGKSSVEIVRAEDAASAIVEAAADYDLMILGVQSAGWRKKVLGKFTLRLAGEAPCATLLLSRRPPRAFELLDPLRDGMVESIRDVVRYSPRRANTKS